MNQVLQGDCLEVLAGLPDQSVGMFLCDLPYGVTACHWDKRIDLDALWVQIRRLLQPKRAAVFTATQPFTTDLICSNREWFRYEWIWEKDNAAGFLGAGIKPLKAHETILVFADSLPSYAPQKTFAGFKSNKRSRTAPRGSSNYRPLKNAQQVFTTERFPRSVLRIPTVKHNTDGCFHPTQKPIALFEYLIRTYTNEGDIVVDPTAGSMTTAIACHRTGRGYVCIEKDPDEYAKGLKRVQDDLAQPQQFNLLEATPQKPKTVETVQTTIFDELRA